MILYEEKIQPYEKGNIRNLTDLKKKGDVRAEITLLTLEIRDIEYYIKKWKKELEDVNLKQSSRKETEKAIQKELKNIERIKKKIEKLGG